MKNKIMLVLILLTSIVSAKAQNLQAYYDFGKNRQCVVTTFELFKADKLGNTFLFADMYYGGKDGAFMAYWEIHRKFTINSVFDGFNVHIQYDDGLTINKKENDGTGYPLDRVFHAGVGFPVKMGDFVLNTTYLCRYTPARNSVDFQVEGTWQHNVWKDRISFKGFVYLWMQKYHLNDAGKFDNPRQVAFLAEPQFWYNINKTFSVGSEIEMSCNFLETNFLCNPTVGVKWNI